MAPEDIRKMNEDLQREALKTKSPAAHDAALKSLECSLLAELAAQVAQLNEGLEFVSSAGHIRVQVEPGQYPVVVETRR